MLKPIGLPFLVGCAGVFTKSQNDSVAKLPKLVISPASAGLRWLADFAAVPRCQQQGPNLSDVFVIRLPACRLSEGLGLRRESGESVIARPAGLRARVCP